MPVIGIDVGGTTVKLGLVENGSDIIYRDTQPSPHEPAAMADLLYQMILSARKIAPGAQAAISMAGHVDKDGYIDANQMGFWHAPVGPLLFEKLGQRVPMENDGIAALMAEYRAGALQGCDSGVMITLGTGIGGGVMLHGQPLRGFRGGQSTNAELGHMITHADGVRCSCGQVGCWEAYASATALSQMAGGMPPREVADRVKKGEMQDLWARYIKEVSQGILGLLSIFYPQVVALGGGLSQAGDILIGGVRDELNRDPNFKSRHGDTKITAARFLNDAGILGAAALL